MKFVPRVVLFDRRLRNRVAALIPDWVEDFVDLLRTNKVDVTEFLDLLKFLFTFVYSVFCSRHFYLRLGVILNRRNPPKAIPGLEKPIPYLLKLFVALNIVAYLDRKGIVHVFFVKWLPSSQIDFNLAVLAFVFFFPMFAFLVIVMLAALIKLFRFSAYDSRLRRATPRLNRQLVALLLRRNFWRRSTFRYKEFLGGIIYYSVNAVILIPVSYYAFLILTTILLWPLATFVGRFQIITPEAATVAASAAFNVIFGVALVCLYVFITQPMLNLVL